MVPVPGSPTPVPPSGVRPGADTGGQPLPPPPTTSGPLWGPQEPANPNWTGFPTPGPYAAPTGPLGSGKNVPNDTPMTIVAGVSIGVAFICSFLPWVSVLFITVNGIDGDGTLTAVLSVVAGGFFGLAVKARLNRRNDKGWIIGSVLAIFLAFAVYTYHLVDLSSMNQSSPNDLIQVHVSPQIGLILGPIAGITAIFGLVMLYRSSLRRDRSTSLPA